MVLCINIKQFDHFLEPLVPTRQKSRTKRVVRMDKNRLKMSLAVLDAAKSRFPEAQKFIENTLREECEKEKITADEVIFFASLKAKN